MTTVSLPRVSINILPATQSISNTGEKVLFVGQKIDGSAVSGELTTNIGNSGEESNLFGKRSILAQSIKRARAINQVTRFDAISLDDNGTAVQAEGSIAFSGTATANGTLYISVGSKANYKLTVNVLTGDTAAEVATAIDSAFDLLLDAPITSDAVSGEITFTASNGGTVGNSYGIQVEGSVAGLTFAITAFTGGANDPSLANLFDVVGEERYQTIIYQSNLDESVLTDFLDPRFNEDNAVNDGVGIIQITDTKSNLTTLGDTLNSKSLVVFANKLVNTLSHKGGAILEFDNIVTSQFGAIRALRLTPDADISDYIITTSGSLDSFGGQSIASLPYFNTPVNNLPLIDIGKGFSKTDVTALNDSGLSVMGNNTSGNGVIIGEVLTTRKTDAAGNEELSFRFLNAVDTISKIREYYVNNLRANFGQSRLTKGALRANTSTANASSIASYLDKLFIEMGEASLAESGDEANKFFKSNRAVTLDLINGKTTITMKMPIVVQLRQIIATMQLSY